MAVAASPLAQGGCLIMRIAPVALLALVTGCATPDFEPPLSCPSQPAPRQVLLDAAALAWAVFDYPILDLTDTTPNLPAGLLGPDPVPLPADARPRPSAPRLGRTESDSTTRPWIADFWRSIDSPAATLERTRQAQLWAVHPAAGWASAWSAAFISWLSCQAGWTASEFPRSIAHWPYVDAALAGTGPYRAEAADHLATPGDLLCADRAENRPPLRRPEDRQAEAGQARPLHCDLVVARAPGRLFVIGGNVADAVTLSILPLDDAGRLNQPDPPLPGRRWFSLLRYQASDAGQFRLPPITLAGSMPPHSARP